MMRSKHMRSLAVAIVLGLPRLAAADYVDGAADDIRQAEAVLVGHAQTVDEAKAWPPPPNAQRITVDEVLVGVWFEQSVVVVGSPLPSGGRVVIVESPVYLRDHPELAVEPPPPRAAPRLWPLGAGDALPPDLAARGADGGLIAMERHGLVLADLRTIAATEKPRETGATARAIDAALLHPTADPIALLYDIARDVPTLAALLESPRAAVRDAAAARLRAITNAPIAAPAGVAPSELAAHRQRWLDWFAAHGSDLLAGRAYPPVPSPVIAPRVARPTALLAALDGSPDARAAAVRAWLDAGVVRDRELRFGNADEHASPWPGADIVGLSWSGPAEQLGSLDEALDPARPAEQRMKALMTRLARIHAVRFAAERAFAERALEAAAPCSADVRAAAYWEADAAYAPGPAATALTRLAACDEPAASALLEAFSLARADEPVIDAVGMRVARGDRAFALRLVDFIRHAGASAAWAASILEAHGYRGELLPIALTWLSEHDPSARVAAAGLLAGELAARASLVAALQRETDAGARRMELFAIAPIADLGALPVLLAIAESADAAANRVPIANALGRIKDARALPALARLALDAGDADLQGAQEATNSFCWISGRCTGHEPAVVLGGAVDPDVVKAGRDAIRRWQAAQRP